MDTEKNVILKESFFNTGDLNLHFLEGPTSGPPLVLLHGATAEWTVWKSLLPHLIERWHVYALDQRGHGASDKAADVSGYHITHFVHDTVAFIREQVGSPVVLLGNSWGGLVSLLSGSLEKDLIRAMVLEEPVVLFRRESEEIKPGIKFFSWLYRIKQSAQSAGEIDAALKQENKPQGTPADVLVRIDNNFLKALISYHEIVEGIDFGQAIDGITCPILLLQGDQRKGGILVQEDIEFIQAHARQAEVVFFEGASHIFHTEKPDEVISAFDRFIEKAI